MLDAAWFILCESAFFILTGFLFAGLLDAFVSTERLSAWLAGTRRRTVFLATIVGAPLPLCSCGVLPTAVMLRRKGAGKGSTLSFLISTPETSVQSILLTYGLLGPAMAIIRPLAACATALLAGLVENTLEIRRNEDTKPTEDETAAESCPSCCEHEHGDNANSESDAKSRGAGVHTALRFAFVDLFDDIFGWLVIGILVAAAIQALLPPEVLQAILGGEVQSMLLMVLIGVPLYICAEASTPIAAALIAQGVSPGAGLVLLLVGPATNIGSLGVLRPLLGTRAIVVYLVSIIAVSIAAGLCTNYFLLGPAADWQVRALDAPLVPGWLKIAAAVGFLLLSLASLGRQRYLHRIADWLRTNAHLPASANGLGITGIILLAAGYVLSGFFVVRPGEVGVVLRFGAIRDANAQPGLHYDLPYPFARVERVPVQRVQRTLIGLTANPDDENALLAAARDSWHIVGDENEADIKVAVHWGVVPAQLVQFQFRTADREALVRNVTLAAIREVLAGASINSVFTAERPDHEDRIARLAQRRLDGYEVGVRIHAFRFLDAHAPPDVHDAFRDVASAVEDRATQIHRARATEARTLPAARARAAGSIEEAQATATLATRRARGEADRFLALLGVYRTSPEVTAQRLEFEMLDRVLPGLTKYLLPPDANAGGTLLDIWFMNQGSNRTSPIQIPPR